MPAIEINGRRVLFIHIPKTGGTSVTRWLQGLGRVRLHNDSKPDGLRCTPQHLTWADIDATWGCDDFDYAFAISRDPFSRMESEFSMRLKVRANSFFGGKLHFSTWLEKSLNESRANPYLFDNHLRPQWNFISDRLKMFRFEDGMDQIIAAVAADLGVAAPPQVPHALPRDQGDRPEFIWDRADILRMQEYYRLDFQQFGYDIEPAVST